jgi:hypothetical protein
VIVGEVGSSVKSVESAAYLRRLRHLCVYKLEDLCVVVERRFATGA